MCNTSFTNLHFFDDIIRLFLTYSKVGDQMFQTIIELLSQVFCMIGYIRSNSFKQPLSKEEETLCLEGLAKGDALCREKLIEHNLRLVAHIVKKYDIKKEQSEDLISIGTIGLIKAIDSFQIEKGRKLTTYASRCIENEILMYLRSSKHYFQTLSLNEPIANEKDGSEMTLLDAIAAPLEKSVVDTMLLKTNTQKLYQYLALLDKRELEIICKRFGLLEKKEQTQREIAKELHISRSYVSRIEKRALMKLYRYFTQEHA